MSKTHLEGSRELATYIEHASCAVSILGDGMMNRAFNAYGFTHPASAAPDTETQPGQ